MMANYFHVELAATLCCAAITTAFTISHTDKTGGLGGGSDSMETGGEDSGENGESSSRGRPTFGHWWILIKDQTLHLRNATGLSSSSVIPTHDGHVDDAEEVDAMSVVWYLGAFGGLIGFFLVVTCSEWCCSRQAGGGVTNCGRSTVHGPSSATPQSLGNVLLNQHQIHERKPQTPPPPYHLFAPPPYTETVPRSPTKRPPSPATSLPTVYVVPLPPQPPEQTPVSVILPS